MPADPHVIVGITGRSNLPPGRASAGTEPTRDAETLAPRRQYLVQKARGQERHQASVKGQDLDERGGVRGVRIDAKRTTIRRLPAVIQVKHAAQLAPAHAAELIQVFAIVGTRRIDREVGLQLMQPQEQAPVHRKAHPLQALPEGPLGTRERPGLQPEDAIGTDLGS